MSQHRQILHGGVSTCNASMFATEYWPLRRWLQHRAVGSHESQETRVSADVQQDDNITRLDDAGLGASEDEIEDC